MNNKSIGVFDSGVGGLTVVGEIMDNLPFESIVYFGDTARVPYGGKSPLTIIKYSREIVSFLISKDVKAIVVACNTASAFALDVIKDEFDIPIIGVIEPGAKGALGGEKILVIGTKGTISSGVYEDEIKKYGNYNVRSKACPLLASLVEENLLESDITRDVLKMYLDDYKDIDTLILGCTHYPLLKSLIKDVVGGVKLVDPAYETSILVKDVLSYLNLLSDNNDAGHQFYVSDDADKFDLFAREVLDIEVNSSKIDL